MLEKRVSGEFKRVLARVLASAEGNGRLEELVEAIARREMDPHTAAERLIQAAD